jgi:hypothetical protein
MRGRIRGGRRNRRGRNLKIDALAARRFRRYWRWKSRNLGDRPNAANFRSHVTSFGVPRPFICGMVPPAPDARAFYVLAVLSNRVSVELQSPLSGKLEFRPRQRVPAAEVEASSLPRIANFFEFFQHLPPPCCCFASSEGNLRNFCQDQQVSCRGRVPTMDRRRRE